MTTPVTETVVLSDYLADAVLQAYFTGPGAWLAIMTDDPGTGGANELQGGGYARQFLTFSTPAAKSVANLTGCTFNGMPAGSWPYLALFDAAQGGDMLASIYLTDVNGNPTPLVTSSSGQVVVNVGDVALGF